MPVTEQGARSIRRRARRSDTVAAREVITPAATCGSSSGL
jgi:hypothetical protein